MELSDAQLDAEKLAEEEKKAVFNVAFFEMFGMYPRKFPLDVSFNNNQVFLIDFICILTN